MAGETAPPDTLGLVLAGGLSRRMGGGDKGLRPLAGVPILRRVAERLRPQCVDLVLSANGDPARFAALRLPIVPDAVPDRPGPLAGMLAGLDWAAENRPDIAFVAVVPGDVPFLPHDLVLRLHAALATADARLATAASGGRSHPTVALLAVDLREELRRVLLSGERRVWRWTTAQGAAEAAWPAEPADPFLNINTPADLDEAERLVAAGLSPPWPGR